MGMISDEDKKEKFGFEGTELRLGLPGDLGKNSNANGKRRYPESVNLKLNLSLGQTEKEKNLQKEKNLISCSNDPIKPPPKAQVVGWPPVRSFRKNIISVQKSNPEEGRGCSATFVKVSMDGAPYLRKVDLSLYKSYQDLYGALGKMFSSLNIGKCDSQGMIDFMNESNLMDLLSGSDFVPTYEDKDSDWMLIGDVPWEMFVGSCKRLRIMKGTEAIGLAPKAMEKCKDSS